MTRVTNLGHSTTEDARAVAAQKLLIAAYHQWILDGRPRNTRAGADVIKAIIIKEVGICATYRDD
jgi:hypothetical protein